MKNQPDDRSPLTHAMELGSLATTIALEMVVPIVLGVLLDQRLGTKVVFAILGGAIGMTGGIWHLVKVANDMSGKSAKDRTRNDDRPQK